MQLAASRRVELDLSATAPAALGSGRSKTAGVTACVSSRLRQLRFASPAAEPRRRPNGLKPRRLEAGESIFPIRTGRSAPATTSRCMRMAPGSNARTLLRNRPMPLIGAMSGSTPASASTRCSPISRERDPHRLTGVEAMVAAFHRSAMDNAAIDRAGLAPIEPELRAIRSARTRANSRG